MPWLLLIIKHILPIFEFCIRHSEGPISRPVTETYVVGLDLALQKGN